MERFCGFCRCCCPVKVGCTSSASDRFSKAGISFAKVVCCNMYPSSGWIQFCILVHVAFHRFITFTITINDTSSECEPESCSNASYYNNLINLFRLSQWACTAPSKRRQSHWDHSSVTREDGFLRVGVPRRTRGGHRTSRWLHRQFDYFL